MEPDGHWIYIVRMLDNIESYKSETAAGFKELRQDCIRMLDCTSYIYNTCNSIPLMSSYAQVGTK